jgi:phospholipid/cholesterol/gamma-HCH transport system substrate-binding protein
VETRANYVMVGSFVLIAIAALMGFVLWLARSELNRNVDT